MIQSAPIYTQRGPRKIRRTVHLKKSQAENAPEPREGKRTSRHRKRRRVPNKEKARQAGPEERAAVKRRRLKGGLRRQRETRRANDKGSPAGASADCSAETHRRPGVARGVCKTLEGKDCPRPASKVIL